MTPGPALILRDAAGVSRGFLVGFPRLLEGIQREFRGHPTEKTKRLLKVHVSVAHPRRREYDRTSRSARRSRNRNWRLHVPAGGQT